MVTRSAADAMQRGEDVPPKLFSDASVFFCDIVNFQMMAMDSQPMDIVKLLNDIYTRFDDVIAKFKVYKVRADRSLYAPAAICERLIELRFCVPPDTKPVILETSFPAKINP